ncbi:hypothetical protein [Aquiflexum gelatinilyticum]|uniref:hypothetical protein n=1 Tax=Aquiflexum gelatinilyticum TaxID=2961943 RepID=UPI0030840241
MGREIIKIGSKANDTMIHGNVVVMKDELVKKNIKVLIFYKRHNEIINLIIYSQ